MTETRWPIMLNLTPDEASALLALLAKNGDLAVAKPLASKVRRAVSAAK